MYDAIKHWAQRRVWMVWWASRLPDIFVCSLEPIRNHVARKGGSPHRACKRSNAKHSQAAPVETIGMYDAFVLPLYSGKCYWWKPSIRKALDMTAIGATKCRVVSCRYVVSFYLHVPRSQDGNSKGLSIVCIKSQARSRSRSRSTTTTRHPIPRKRGREAWLMI